MAIAGDAYTETAAAAEELTQVLRHGGRSEQPLHPSVIDEPKLNRRTEGESTNRR